MSYYCNFKRFTENGQRVAIFGEPNAEGKMEITIIKCSKKDQFSRKFARQAYEALKAKVPAQPIVHPERRTIIMGNVNTPKKEFLSYCKENFFIKSSIALVSSAVILDSYVQNDVSPAGLRQKLVWDVLVK